jgi:hypothetical protein
MANRYWVGGTGDWNATAGSKWSTTSGGAGGSAAPTAADDVYIDLGSGSVTVTVPASTTVVCRSLNFVDGTGGAFTGTFVMAATTSIITIGDGTAGAGNNALKIASGMTWTNTAVGTINFISTSATQQTITSGGKTLPTITINGAGSSYILGDALTQVVTGVVTTFNLFAGTFNTGNYNMTTLIWNVATAGTKTLTLGSSAITVARNATAIQFDPTGLTVTANTAVFTCTAQATVSMTNTNMNGASIVFTSNGNATMQNGGTWANVTRTGTANKTDTLIVSVTGFTVTGTLTLTANSDINRIFVNSNVRGSSRTITAANVVITNTVDFMDITGAGAATWTTGASGASFFGDAGGNSGITMTTPATQTITSGAWDNVANWTSRIPLPQDDVILTGSSAITLNQQRIGNDLDFSAYTGTLTLATSAATYDFFGSVIIGSGMSWGTNPNTFNINASGRGTHTITSNGKAFFPAGSNSNFAINGFGGTYSLSDALDLRTPTSATFSVTAGSFVSNNYNMNIGRLVSVGALTRSVNFGTSTVSLYATGGITLIAFVATGLTLSALSAVFTVINTTASTRTLDLGGQWIGTFNYTIAGSTGQLNVTQAGIISNLNFSDASNARTLQITQGIALTCLNFNVTGTAGNLMTVKSSTTTLAYLSSPLQLYNSSQDYIAYEYIGVNQPQSLWLNTNSTASNSKGISATEPAYKHVQSTSSTATGTSLSVNYILPTVAGNLLVAYFTSSNTQGTFTPPSGWTQAVTNSNGAFVYIFYKVADGSETTVSFTQTVSRTLNLVIAQYQGFTGTPTLDVTDTNVSSGSVTSLATTSGTAPTNTDQPALAFAAIVNPSALAATTGVTDDFIEDRTNTALSTVFKGAVKELTTLAPVETTISWTTSRANTAAVLAVFKDVAVIPTNTGNFFAFF